MTAIATNSLFGREMAVLMPADMHLKRIAGKRGTANLTFPASPSYRRPRPDCINAQPTRQPSKRNIAPHGEFGICIGRLRMLGTILLILLILLVIGALPTWGYSRSWGYGPTGGLGLVLVIVLILVLLGRI